MEADGEVAQGDHVAGGGGFADLAGVLPEADIANIVGSGLRRPNNRETKLVFLSALRICRLATMAASRLRML